MSKAENRLPRRRQLGNFCLWYRQDRDEGCICWYGRSARARRHIATGVSCGSQGHPQTAGLKCPKPQIACRDDGSLETSGSGIARIETNGASAGTIDSLVADAASARALAAVRLTHHQSRLKRHSQRISSDTTVQ